MRVKVRAFAGLREALGFNERAFEMPAGVQVGEVVAHLAAQFPSAKLKDRRFSLAVNRVSAKPDQVLNDGDELALIPPVSGG